MKSLRLLSRPEEGEWIGEKGKGKGTPSLETVTVVIVVQE